MKKQTSPVSEVHHDQNRHTCIVVERGPNRVGFIRMAMADVKVEWEPEHSFAFSFQPVPDYPPERAARRYLDSFAELKLEISPEARAHLERIAGPAFKRVSLAEEDPAPKPQPQLKKDPEMSDAKKAAPAKKPVPTKAAAPAAKKDAPAKKAAPAKVAPAKSAPTKKDAAPAEAKRGRQPSIAGTAKIKVLVAENPKRGTAADRFALYKNGMTVDDYIAAGGTRADVNWDVKQAFIEVK